MNRGQHEEARFQKYFINNTDIVLGGCIIMESEKSLYPAFHLLEKEINSRMRFGEITGHSKARVIGRIDIMMKYGGVHYAVEIKYQPCSNNDFWDAIKILGYTEYVNWQEDYIKKFKPAIMMPLKRIKLEHKLVANKLKITLFGITKIGGSYEVNLIEE